MSRKRNDPQAGYPSIFVNQAWDPLIKPVTQTHSIKPVTQT
ncbi:hypothetical protein GFS31_24700 [Leptolyngbya sp. BL0902]|nr:hypothetical protein GFS31_24700 [Leptolyngbya sp. BL0902]